MGIWWVCHRPFFREMWVPKKADRSPSLASAEEELFRKKEKVKFTPSLHAVPLTLKMVQR